MDDNKDNADIPATCRQLCEGDGRVKPLVVWRESELFYLQRKVNALRETKLTNCGGGDAEAVRLEKLRKLEMNDFIHLQNALEASSQGLVAAKKKRVHLEICHSLDTYEKFVEAAKDKKTTVEELDKLNASAAELVQARKVLIARINFLRQKCRLENLENLLENGLKAFHTEEIKLRDLRQEIDVRLKDRELFNTEWRKMISKLDKGKMYLKSIIDQGTRVSLQREEIVEKIKELNWKGESDLWRDTMDMVELNHTLGDLYKRADFLWIKGTIRKTDEEEKTLIREEEEEKIMYKKIESLCALLGELQAFNNLDCIPGFLQCFKMDEETINSIFNCICSMESEMIFTRYSIAKTNREVEQRRIENCQRKFRQDDEIEELQFQYAEAHKAKLNMIDKHNQVSSDLYYAIVQIQEIMRMLLPNANPLLNLLGEKFKVTKHNYHIFLKLIGETVMELFSIASHHKYLRVKKKKKRAIKFILSPETNESLDRSSIDSQKSTTKETKKLLFSSTETDESPDRSSVESQKSATKKTKKSRQIKSKKKGKKKLKFGIRTKLSLDIKTGYFVPKPTRVLYIPCVYCQEEYIFQQPPIELAEPLSDEQILKMLTGGKINTLYNIQTRTVPGKSHGSG